MDLTKLLDRPIAFHRVFVDLTHSVKAAVMLSQAVYWQKRARQSDGWWYKTQEEWEEETGLSRHEQDTARKQCKDYLQSKRKDVPARLYWKVDVQRLSEDLIAISQQTSLPDSGKQDCDIPSDINKNTETTTETTTTGEENLEEIKNSANITVDGILGFAKLGEELKANGKSYPNRSFMPEQYLEYCDTFVRETGMTLLKSKKNEWILAFEDWMAVGATKQDIVDAVKEAYGNDKKEGFPYSSPNSLTNTINRIAGKRRKENRSSEDNQLERSLAKIRGGT